MYIYIIIATMILFYIYSKRNHKYWLIRNIKHDPPVPLFGNHLSKLLKIKTAAEFYGDIYFNNRSERYFGHYRGSTPELVIIDPEMVKHIVNSDFLYFHIRSECNPKQERWTNNLFAGNGDDWKLLRQWLTSAFTASKLRKLFPLLLNCTQRLQEIGATIASSGQVVDAYKLLEHFTIEFIGVFAFGIEMDTMHQNHSLLLELGENIFHRSKWQVFLITLEEIFPQLKQMNLSVKVTDEVKNTILKITRNVREQRKYKPSVRKDFMDILTEMVALGKISGEALAERNPDGTPATAELEVDELCLAAQVYAFFGAGYETSASVSSYTLHLLAYHPDVQRNVQTEIDQVLAKYDNRICYEALSELTYLEQAIKESIRIFPPAGFIGRTCTKRYTLPGTSVTIDPGVRIIIPAQAFHMDERYFDEPEEFRPERFAPDVSKKRNKYVYLPFGEGPRKCIGVRLGLMQSMAAITSLLQRFSVSPAPTSVRRPRVKRTSFIVQSIEGGLPILLTPRQREKSAEFLTSDINEKKCEDRI